MQNQPRTILISGAGRGIGRATALAFAQPNTTIVIASRTQDDLDSLAREIAERGGTAISVSCDVTNEHDVQHLVNHVHAIDVLVCAAGIARVMPFEQLSLDDWNATINTNLTGTFLLCKYAVPKMTAGSTIIAVSSIAGKTGFPNWAAYSAAKFGVMGFLQAIREEVRPRGIRVTAIVPSAVDTPLWDGIAGNWNRQNMLQPAEVASVIVHVASQPAHIQMDEVGVGHVVGKL